MKKGQNLRSLSEPKQEKAKIKHLFQVPKYFEESKFISLVLVNMNKLGAIMVSFFWETWAKMFSLCLSASQLLKSTSVRFYFLICPRTWMILLARTYFKMKRGQESKICPNENSCSCISYKRQPKFYLFFKTDSEEMNPWVVTDYN